MICVHVFERLARGVTHPVNTTKDLIINITHQEFFPFRCNQLQELIHTPAAHGSERSFRRVLCKKTGDLSSSLHHPAVAFSQILQIASPLKPLRTDYRHFVITDIEVIEVKSRKLGVIEQLLTRGSTSITRAEGQDSEGVRKDQQFVQQTTLKETHKRRVCFDWCLTLWLSWEPAVARLCSFET